MSFLEAQITQMEESLVKAKKLQAEHNALLAAPLPTIREQVAAQMLPTPAAAPAQVAAVAPEAAILQGLMAELKGVFAKALTPEELAYMTTHIAEGAPGIIPFLKSETIVAMAQLLHTEYIDFLAGKSK